MIETPIIVLAISFVVLIFAIISISIRWYKKPISGKAIVRTGSGGIRISFDKGIFVIPTIHRLQDMDITLKKISINLTGEDSILCKDEKRADAKLDFFVRVNNSIMDVTNVALSVGCDRTHQQAEIESLFYSKFKEAALTVGQYFTFSDLYKERDRFKMENIDLLGTNLNGFVLDDLAIEYIRQGPDS